MSDCGGHDHCQRDELLARVEAADGLVTDAVELLEAMSSQDFREYGCACGPAIGPCYLHATTIPEFLARAALACPPQQRGEK